MWVNQRSLDHTSVQGNFSKWQRVLSILGNYLSNYILRFLKTKNKTLHSLSIMPSLLVRKINESDADIINLHWVQGEMLSVEDIGRIKKPIVITLLDMWTFCGAEHYTDDFRWYIGYYPDNRPSHEMGMDINRWTWNRKYKSWKKPMYVVGTSWWITECARKSALMKAWPSECIGLPINLDIWKPINKKISRNLLDLPCEIPIILFGAIGGTLDHRKGYDLLIRTLIHLKSNPITSRMELVVFGQSTPANQENLYFPVHYLGHINDDLTFKVIYNSADAVIVPSRQEAFGQIALEAQACGIPVVAFKVGGLVDIVDHLQTGYLAKPDDPYDLAEGIVWVLKNKLKKQISSNARRKVETQFADHLVGEQYLQVYEKILSKNS